MEDKLEEVRAGKAGEYLNPLTELQENMKIRTQVAGKSFNRFHTRQMWYKNEELVHHVMLYC